jgi:hypothetical protein
MWDKLLGKISGTTDKFEEWYTSWWLWMGLIFIFFFMVTVIVLLLVLTFNKPENNMSANESRVVNNALAFCKEHNTNAWDWKNSTNHSNLKFYCYNATLDNNSVDDFWAK